MADIVFLPFEKKTELDGHLSILQLAQKADLPLQSTCGGKRVCGKCKVVVEKTDGPLLPPSEREQEVVRLRFVAGLSHRAIGKAMGLRPGNVAVIVYRALRKLRARLEREGE